ncbi:glycosyl hydrolase family 8 (plasmid) [Aquamicrobium terrae]
MTFHVLALALLVAGLMPNTARPQILPEEWTTYQERFVAEDGRVVDDGNGGISHSEGQGYGLLLAVLSGDRPGFERIWSFTQRELMLRDDGLAAWKWDPATTPHIMDANNASDGDILIAYALAQADALWSEDGFGESARQIAQALARTSVFEHHGEMLLRPGVAGFAAGERPDGPVVNPSYWVFEAFPVLETLAPETDWQAVARSGRKIASAGFGDRRLPPDWLSMAAKPVPAEGFPAEFGYNALRIPLYLMRAHDPDMELLKRMRDGMTGPSGGVARVDLDAGRVIEELTDPGYRIIPALASCILDRQPLADDLTRFTPTNYYPSTLHLLSLSFARKERPECL